MILDARKALAVALSATLLGALGCPGDPTVPTPLGPPQISITVSRSDLVGSEVPFKVNISGCEQVDQLDIFDSTTYLKTLPATLPTTEGTLLPNEFNYTKGLALPIALNAKVTCSDGRAATSRTQALTFLPVEQVITLPNDEQVVTDYFVPEDSGEATTFLGCFVLANGNTAIARVNLAGVVIDQSLALPGFTCTHNTVFTDKHPVTKKRWVYDEAGAVAVDEDLDFSGTYPQQISTLMVDPASGDAIIVTDTTQGFYVRRQRHTAPGSPTWSKQTVGALIGRPAITSAVVFLPVADHDAVESTAQHHISVLRLDMGTGVPSGSTVVLTDELDTLPFTGWTDFNVTVSEDGSRVYVPRLIDDRHAAVRACPVIEDGCADFLWQTPPLDEYPTLILPYNNGSRVAVVSVKRAHFFNAQNGSLYGEFLAPQGAGQFFTHAVPSKGEAFFLMSSSVNSQQQAFNLPAEIVALDSAQQGELFRYQAPAGSVTMAFDDSGHPWMRIGSALVKPYPLADYRAALTSGAPPGTDN